jgi:hypothetical protein
MEEDKSALQAVKAIVLDTFLVRSFRRLRICRERKVAVVFGYVHGADTVS